MADEAKIYRCEVCGNVVGVLNAGVGELVCCGQPMTPMDEKTASSEGKEKHVPVIEKIDGGVRVKVGSTPHPMEEKHYIQVIQLVRNGRVFEGKRLHFSDAPVAEFCCIADTEGLTARALCNIHGLWKSE
ncbi:MAG: desulfoferrodoxin [Elusimicrobiota bacterium]|nr:desulfoferrodoxin [Elusimicrobiota bacterium]